MRYSVLFFFFLFVLTSGVLPLQGAGDHDTGHHQAGAHEPQAPVSLSGQEPGHLEENDHLPAGGEAGAHDDSEHHEEPSRHQEDDHDHGVEVATDDHSGHADEGEEAHEGELELNETQKKEIGLTVAVAGPGSLLSELTLTGEIRLNEDRLTHVVPRLSGVAVQIPRSVGDRVEAGELLAELDSTELGEAKSTYLELFQEVEILGQDLERGRRLSANSEMLLDFLDRQPNLEELQRENFGDLGDFRARLTASYADLVTARTTYERKKLLFEERISSENDFFAARNEFEKAQALYRTEYDNARFESGRLQQEARRAFERAELQLVAAERRLLLFGLSEKELRELNRSDFKKNLTRAVVLSPQAGTIIERHVSRGEKLSEESDIFTIADLSTVWADLRVAARDVHLVRAGDQVVLESADGLRSTGRVGVVLPVADEATRTITVRVEVDNRDGHWRPGSFVNGFVRLAAKDLPVVVPLAAVQTLEGREVVFLADDHGFRPQPVVTGRRDRAGVEIIQGLAKGNRYVERGAFELKAMAVTAGAGAHAGHGH